MTLSNPSQISITDCPASFRALLPSSYDFHFVDGDLICDPSPGVDDMYTGPYRCWYDTPTTEKVARAHAQVSAIISDLGPFEMVMGFSQVSPVFRPNPTTCITVFLCPLNDHPYQGAALAASLILHHQMEHPSEPPLFRAAIFICAPLPFACSPNHGIDVRKYFGVEVPEPLSTDRPTTVPARLIPAPSLVKSDRAVDHSSKSDSDSDSDSNSDSNSSNNGSDVTSTASRSGRSTPFSKSSTNPSQASLSTGFVAFKPTAAEPTSSFYNMFHATADSIRIVIPTAHIYGLRDAWRPHSLDLAMLCAGPVVAFQHDGGHEVPRAASEMICDAVEEIVACAGLEV